MKIYSLIIILCLTIITLLSSCGSNVYNNAVLLMDSGNYSEAIVIFNALEDYKDSAELSVECQNEIDYASAIALMDQDNYSEAAVAFTKLGNFKDSIKLVLECQNEIINTLNAAIEEQQRLNSTATLGEGNQRVFDNANVISKSEISELEAFITILRTIHNMDFIVLTSYDAEIGESLSFADDFYDYNGFGVGPNWDGLIFFIDMNNRVPTISTCGLMIRFVTDVRLDALFDTSYDYLTAGEFGKAAYITLSQLDSFIKDEIPSGQYNIDEYGNIS